MRRAGIDLKSLWANDLAVLSEAAGVQLELDLVKVAHHSTLRQAYGMPGTAFGPEDINHWARKLKLWQAAAEPCESPIEKLMLWALLGEMRLDVLHGNKVLVDDDEAQGHLLLQETVGELKADFLLVTAACPLTTACQTVIECDGHEFHTTVKRQARDRRIDRELQRQGYAILRFTGSQINADPKACAIEVKNFITSRQAAGGRRQ